jgi:gliding motility-associated lipoprotein GldH
MRYPDGRFRTDTVEMILADPSGKWKGSGIGDLFDRRMLYMQDVLLPDTGMYQVIIKQAMRPMRLKGIQDIGFRLEKGKY